MQNNQFVLQALMKELNLKKTDLEAIRPHWEESVRTMPSTSILFLDASEIQASAEYCSLDKSLIAEIHKTAQIISKNRPLKLLAWHCKQCLYEYTDSSNIKDWPDLEGVLGNNAGIFYLIVGLSVVPMVRKVHRSMGIPGQITRDTCMEINCKNNNHRAGTGGRNGILRKQLYWLRHYTEGRLFRLGRFEYMLKEIDDFITVFRNIKTGEVMALAKNETLFNSEGFIYQDMEKGETGFLSYLVDDNDVIRGTPISPYGMGMHNEAVLEKSRWKRVLGTSDTVLNMHIPSGGNMNPEACQESFISAFDFFQHYFPDKDTRAIVSSSWIFNTQLEENMPDSNMARFMRELYLFPIPLSGRSAFFHIFYREIDDLSMVPRDTRLQRMIVEIFESGGRFRKSGMFFLKEDLPYFGTQYYRRNTSLRYSSNLSSRDKSSFGMKTKKRHKLKGK